MESLQGETALWQMTVFAPEFSLTAFVWDASSWLQSPLPTVSNLGDVSDFMRDILVRTRLRLQMAILDPIWRFGWRDQACAVHLTAMSQWVSRSRSACESHNLKSFSSEGVLPDRTLGWYDGLRLNPSAFALSSLRKAIPRALSLETQRTLIETHIALRRYTLRHGEAPERLDQLVPAFLPAIPIDGMVGQPLRFRRNPDGSTTLWSVGEDFKDDGGTAAVYSIEHSPSQWWNGFDMVVPTAVGETEYVAWKAEARRRWNDGLTMDPILARRYGLTRKGSAATNTSVTNAGAFKLDPILARRYGVIPKDSATTNSPAPK